MLITVNELARLDEQAYRRGRLRKKQLEPALAWRSLPSYEEEGEKREGKS
jgi:hypothetical protein